MKFTKLNHDYYFDIERIVRKIAEENNIKDVSKINIRLSKEAGFVKFAIIDDWAEYPEDTNDWEGADTYKHGPYVYNIVYNTVTPESAEIGDYADSGFEVQGATADDMDDLISQLDDYGFYQDNNSDLLSELSFST